ncbi:DUF2170 family protein [Escherichia coli]
MTWNPLALATALQTVPEQNIDVTNSENALIIKMNDYGDLQINILFTSRQMIIETFICPVSSISNPDEFNTFLLRNQKMMPLSSVGISSVQQEEYYIVFGALSLKSSLEDWICPYISRHLLSLNPLLACCRRYSRGER